MCIIVAKKKNGKMPSMETLENCFLNNDDGCGMMYIDNGDVVIEKGFLTFDKFKDRLNELLYEYNNFEGLPFVAHFRIGTQGENDSKTCHPFPITSKNSLLKKQYLRTDLAMVHNGIINEYSQPAVGSVYASGSNKGLSDTQLFIKYCVSAFKSLNRNFYKNSQVMKCLETITESKLCFMDREGDLYFVGNFIEDDGVFYSNYSYSYGYNYNYGTNTPTTYGECGYDYGYDYGYDDYEYSSEINMRDIQQVTDDVWCGGIAPEWFKKEFTYHGESLEVCDKNVSKVEDNIYLEMASGVIIDPSKAPYYMDNNWYVYCLASDNILYFVGGCLGTPNKKDKGVFI